MENSKIICFVGEANAGKTTTITKVVMDLFNIVEVIYLKKKGDFVVYFMYKEKKIGVCSSGDVYKEVKERIEKLENAGCQIIICASRKVNGKVYRYLKSKSEIFEEIPCTSPTKEQKKDEKFWKPEHDRRLKLFKDIFDRLTS